LVAEPVEFRVDLGMPMRGAALRAIRAARSGRKFAGEVPSSGRLR
jgi:hypothetical protein